MAENANCNPGEYVDLNRLDYVCTRAKRDYDFMIYVIRQADDLNIASHDGNLLERFEMTDIGGPEMFSLDRN
ncbi:uncharacterized protein PHALS_06045 [Plasmopara halstedii]|uniref:Uncharacterized protein n=1 Tax=Plasmopara halstedii TaxID=4781 RepID=A0A0P1ABQ9_PLAHL|nr:uncharacterized protein PHALS_06045 [Plasmopara halstedii]CEG38002.1 hypothetical protein PHALS_06045 [Plasmopara halstedii]|eukprot:XP_024574371.1 hypothetical protein PHALS_06045 [Plasmopara halstedii]